MKQVRVLLANDFICKCSRGGLGSPIVFQKPRYGSHKTKIIMKQVRDYWLMILLVNVLEVEGGLL